MSGLLLLAMLHGAGGISAQPVPAETARPAASSPARTVPAPAYKPLPQQRVIYWGNSATGKAVRFSNNPDAEMLAERMVKKIGGSGWKKYEDDTRPGYGAAVCVSDRRSGSLYVHFITVHGYPSAREALAAAKQKAVPIMKEVKAGNYLCSNAFWLVNTWLPDSFDAEQSLIEKAKGRIRHEVTKDYLAKPCRRLSQQVVSEEMKARRKKAAEEYLARLEERTGPNSPPTPEQLALAKPDSLPPCPPSFRSGKPVGGVRG